LREIGDTIVSNLTEKRLSTLIGMYGEDGGWGPGPASQNKESLNQCFFCILGFKWKNMKLRF